MSWMEKDLFDNSYRELAANIGIGFHTPEQFFLDAQPEPYQPPFDPPTYLANLESAALANADALVTVPFIKMNPQELVIFCGSPGAGKSSFFWDVLQPLGYERVNQDILKTVCSLPPFPSMWRLQWSIPSIFLHPQHEFEAETCCSNLAG